MRVCAELMLVVAACGSTTTSVPIVDPRTVCAAFRAGDLKGVEAAAYSQLARTGALDTPSAPDVVHDWLLSQRCIAEIREAPCDDEAARFVLGVHYRDERRQPVVATLREHAVRLAWDDRGCNRRRRAMTWEERELAELRRFWRRFR